MNKSGNNIINKTLFEIENNLELLNFKIGSNNILLWPFVRYRIFKYILNKKIYFQKAQYEKKGPLRKNFLSIFGMLFKNIFFSFKKFPLVWLTSTPQPPYIKRGKYFNKRDDYFGAIYENKSLFIEKSSNGKFLLPRYHKHVKNRDLISLFAQVFRKINHIREEDKNTIDNFIKFLKRNYPDEIDENFLIQIKKSLISFVKGANIELKLYQWLFKKINPDLIFFQNATYGRNGHLVKLAKSLDIKTAEFQHGAVSPNHFGYNFGNQLIENNEYIEYIPDYLLTYGKFWNNQTNTSSKKIVVGNPHFTELLQHYYSKGLEKENKIMIISQGSVTDYLVDLAINLSEIIKVQNLDFHVIFRLHPNEVPFSKRYEKLNKYDDIEISDKGDIYQLFYRCKYIVGVYSTAVFEAIGFSEMVFIYNHPLARLRIPKEFGIWVNSAEDIILNINNNHSNFNPNSVNYFFDKNWKTNFKSFIKNEIKIH